MQAQLERGDPRPGRPQRHVAAHHRPAAAGGLTGAGGSKHQRAVPSTPRGGGGRRRSLPRPGWRSSGCRRTWPPSPRASRGLTGSVLPAAAGPHGGGRPGAPDRLRQRRQPAPGPRLEPAAGGGRPPRPRGQSPAPGAPAADREPAPGPARGAPSGLLVARWILAFLLSLIASGTALEVGLDPRVLAFTLGVSVLTALLFGLVPARRATRVDLDPALKSQNVIPGEPLRGLSLRKGLVISQVALSLLLLVVAGLFLRSLQNLRSQELGFRADGVLRRPHRSPGRRLRARAASRALSRSGREARGAAGRGVGQPVALRPADRLPSGAGRLGARTTRRRSDEASLDRGDRRSPPATSDTIGAPLLAGRELDERDREGAPKVAMVNQAFARHYFGDESPLGRRFGVDGEESESGDRDHRPRPRPQDPRSSGVKRRAWPTSPSLSTRRYLHSLEVHVAVRSCPWRRCATPSPRWPRTCRC